MELWTASSGPKQTVGGMRGESDGVMDSRGSSRQGKMERERRLLDKPETRVLPVCCPC